MLCDECGKNINTNKNKRPNDYYTLPEVDLDIANVEFDEVGRLVKAYVINGDWTLKKQGDEWLILDGVGHVHNRWSYVEYEVIKKEEPQHTNNECDEDDIPF